MDFNLLKKKTKRVEPLGSINIVATDFNPLKKKIEKMRAVGSPHVNRANAPLDHAYINMYLNDI